MDIQQISGLILAGGRGTRMGTVDKGLQPFHGAPMVRQVMQRLAPQVGTLIINANHNLEAYRAFGLPVWPDVMPDYAGPLAGLQAGLSHCDTDYLVSVPCDSPFLPQYLVTRLSAALEQAGADLALAVTINNSKRQRHPVFSLMKSSLLPQLTTYLQAGGRKMDDWLATLATVEVSFDDDAAFSNINTIEELKKLEAS
jgi:molybdopterin-guanine dinucleotide biosynthesis protein A